MVTMKVSNKFGVRWLDSAFGSTPARAKKSGDEPRTEIE